MAVKIISLDICISKGHADYGKYIQQKLRKINKNISTNQMLSSEQVSGNRWKEANLSSYAIDQNRGPE